jgi:hypothetical protein
MKLFIYFVDESARTSEYIKWYCGCLPLSIHWQATTDVRKTRGCNYSFWAPDDKRCVA